MSSFDLKSIKGAELQALATEIAKVIMSDGSVVAQALASLNTRQKSVESAIAEIGNAGLGERGLVPLLTSTTSESENCAATPKSVKTAYDSLNTSKQNKLDSQTAYSAKGSETKVPRITTNELGQVTKIEEVTITQPDVSGKLDIDASNATSVTAEGIFNNSAERPGSDSYNVSSFDVVLVQDVKNGVIGLPRRTTVERLLSNVNSNIRTLADNKFDKENIVQNLNASNEDKVPSQKAVKNLADVVTNKNSLKDFGDSSYEVKIGYKGQSIEKVTPTGETTSANSKYLISVYHDSSENVSYYKDVDVSNVTVGRAVADAEGNSIQSTYATMLPRNISASGIKNIGYLSPSILCVRDGVAITSTTISDIVTACVSSGYRKKDGYSYKILNASANTVTITGFAQSKTWSLPAKTFMTAVCWGGEYYREDT